MIAHLALMLPHYTLPALVVTNMLLSEVLNDGRDSQFLLRISSRQVDEQYLLDNLLSGKQFCT